ncbi:MAG: hypothetical protein BWY83_00357 [bacterium ADurb.Bin478]|nr:MAG: hypothetical protein BWY83_00357 [bacterium ADurb.Bin478]
MLESILGLNGLCTIDVTDFFQDMVLTMRPLRKRGSKQENGEPNDTVKIKVAFHGTRFLMRCWRYLAMMFWIRLI